MSNQKAAGTFKPILEGFRRISKTEQSEYLKYFNLLIERQNNLREKKRLLKFKAKLDEEISKR